MPDDSPPDLSPEFASLLDAPLLEHLDLEVVKQYRAPLPGLGSTERVERTDRTIEGDPPVEVRIHRPRSGSSHPRPCVLSIHGGGFIIGSFDMDDARFETWSGVLGVIGVSVNYRLAPESPYPGALQDCDRALTWVHENASDLGIDSSRIGVYGPSAGGGLAAALALMVRDRGEIRLGFQLLEAPMLDDRRTTQSSRLDGLVVWNREANEFAWQCYLGDIFGEPDVPAYAAPARATELSGLPPSFISVGGADGFRDEDIEYALRLSRAGVPTELHVYPGAPHGYQMFVESTAAQQGARDAGEWLARVVAPS